MRHSTYLRSLLAAGLLSGNCLAAETEVPNPDLTGVVKGDQGQPLVGASIFIYTAAPRVGVGYI